MAKTTARNGIILIGGYNLSTYGSAYEVGLGCDALDATGFCDGWRNYVPGLNFGQMSYDMFWDSAASKSVAALQPLGEKCVTLLPEGYALGTSALSMHSTQENFTPGGSVSGILLAGKINFRSYGDNAGPVDAVALQHGTITNTLTGTAFQRNAAPVTGSCMGFLHIWQACAADTYSVKIRHCTTAGGTYADLVTFTLNGSAIGSEHITVASGTINQYIRVEATRTGSAGNTFGFSVSFWQSV